MMRSITHHEKNELTALCAIAAINDTISAEYIDMHYLYQQLDIIAHNKSILIPLDDLLAMHNLTLPWKNLETIAENMLQRWDGEDVDQKLYRFGVENGTNLYKIVN